MAQRSWLEPVENYRRLKADIAEAFVFYANVYTSPANNEQLRLSEQRNSEVHEKASVVFRELATRLEGFCELRYRMQPHVPRKEKLHDVAGN